MTQTPIKNEHFVPEGGLNLLDYLQKGDIESVHHIIRYIWAVEVLKELQPATVLDIACGSGYGSYLIAQHLPSTLVVGADYDQRALEYAKQHFTLTNLGYKLGDTTSWKETLGSTVFDCIISFDTLEHVQHREIMMENLVAHLKPTGCMLFSTPCGSDQNSLQPEWEFHQIEYSTASLYDFLRRYFTDIVGSDHSTFPHLEVFDRLKETPITYLLRLNPVICRGPVIFENPYNVLTTNK